MINWISANNTPKECSYKKYLVTVEYNGDRSVLKAYTQKMFCIMQKK